MRKMRNLFVASSFAFSAAVGSTVAQPNDSCATPDALSGFGTFPFDTSAATSTPLAIGCGAGQAFNDVWFCWTPSQGGPVAIDFCNGDIGFDTLVGVYAGCACPVDNSQIACNDDSCGLQSRTAFFAESGQTYLIRVGAFAEGQVGAGTMNIASGIIHTTTNPANGHTYHLYAATTWTGAEAVAVALGGHLVTVNDAEENAFVQLSVMMFDGADRRAWLGFNDVAVEGTFVWSSGETATYTNWNGGEPNNANGTEHYTEMLGSNGAWNDQPDGGNGLVGFAVAEVGEPECTADFNNDTFVNSQDFFDFLTAFFAQAPNADFNEDGVINSQDYFDFITVFFEGC